MKYSSPENGNHNGIGRRRVRLLLAGSAILMSLCLSPTPVHAQTCLTDAVLARIQTLKKQLQNAPDRFMPTSTAGNKGFEYQLAEAQVALEGARAREFTSPSRENTIVRQKIRFASQRFAINGRQVAG